MSAGPDFALAVLDFIFGDGANGFAPATYSVALSTADPGIDGSGFAEPVAGDYSRVTLTNNATNFPGASLVGDIATKNNGATITFSEAVASWGTITHWGLYGVINTVEILTVFGALNAPVIVPGGSTFKMPLGGMVITLT